MGFPRRGIGASKTIYVFFASLLGILCVSHAALPVTHCEVVRFARRFWSPSIITGVVERPRVNRSSANIPSATLPATNLPGGSIPGPNIRRTRFWTRPEEIAWEDSEKQSLSTANDVEDKVYLRKTSNWRILSLPQNVSDINANPRSFQVCANKVVSKLDKLYKSLHTLWGRSRTGSPRESEEWASRNAASNWAKEGEKGGEECEGNNENKGGEEINGKPVGKNETYLMKGATGEKECMKSVGSDISSNSEDLYKNGISEEGIGEAEIGIEEKESVAEGSEVSREGEEKKTEGVENGVGKSEVEDRKHEQTDQKKIQREIDRWVFGQLNLLCRNVAVLQDRLETRMYPSYPNYDAPKKNSEIDTPCANGSKNPMWPSLRKYKSKTPNKTTSWGCKISSANNTQACLIWLETPPGKKSFGPLNQTDQWVSLEALNTYRRYKSKPQLNLLWYNNYPLDFPDTINPYLSNRTLLLGALLDSEKGLRASLISGLLGVGMTFRREIMNVSLSLLTSKQFWKLYPLWSRVFLSSFPMQLFLARMAVTESIVAFEKLFEIFKSSLVTCESRWIDRECPITHTAETI